MAKVLFTKPLKFLDGTGVDVNPNEDLKGSEKHRVTFNIGQDVNTDSDVQFNQLNITTNTFILDDSSMVLFENQIKMTQDRAISKMGKVNFDAASRMKAAVNSEFIEPRVTMLARKQIEKISDETYRHIKVFCMIRRQALVGGSMRLTEDDEMVTYRRMKDEIYNFVHEKLGK